ncbi:MAG: twin-arginine translocase TatA/TatE family subunit [Anaerolineales bacterium]
MPNLGPTELIIILVIAVLLFGVGRLGRLGGELGKGIREFRRGIQDDESDGESNAESDEEVEKESDKEEAPNDSGD